MSNDFRENGYIRQPEDGAIERLPADLEAIYDRLARDGEGWARRLPEAASLQGYPRALADGMTTVDATATPEGETAGPWDNDGLLYPGPRRPEVERRTPTTHLRPNRRAIWGGAVSAVAIVALLASTFALISHVRGTGNHTTTTATATPTAPSCAPDQISLTLPPYSVLAKLAMISPTEGWAIGYTVNPSDLTANPDPFLVHFHQCRWGTVPSPALGATVYLRDISMETADDGWAVGTEGTGDSARCLLLHYTGGQWLRAPLPSVISSQPSSCDTIAMRSPDEGWLLGTWGTPTGFPASNHLLHYTNGTWAQIDIPISGVSALSPVGPDDVWVAGARLPANTDPDRADRVNMAHYQHGQWTTFYLSVGAAATFRMDSPSDGWLVSWTVPQQVLHYDGISWQPTEFSAHAPSPGNIDVFDGNDAWAMASTNEGIESTVTSLKHYVEGKWQVVPWPFQNVGMYFPLTRVAPGDYWAVGIHVYNLSSPDQTNSQGILLHYVDGVWHEYGA